MTFQVQEVPVEGILEMVTAERDAFETPPQPIFKLYCPISNNDRAKTNADTAAEQQRYVQESAPNVDVKNIWIKAKATSPGSSEADEELAGAAQWIFTVPGPNPSLETKIEHLARRHPEGGARIFAAEAFRILCECNERHRLSTGPHRPYATLGTFFTMPQYRRRGIGSVLLEWGLRQADEKQMDIWIEAAPSAVSVYERHGFVQKEVIHLKPRCPDGLSETVKAEWEAVEKSILPVTAVVMCRLSRLTL
ncbi:N-acetyltransferase domain-containing protein [Penicillium ucsense]|uniref:N-acetyltransferase domain-containing protein n=1 Tax=Penicillium ucsense TaxID=2839758 RepID=A0A8J8W907_9EURO|nr:N-acetyltransferase domain-containing protein [Penicillium ucsense]KAF7733907.1 N-acetyltransferase domain-containing protein [Penicillium ucsense]